VNPYFKIIYRRSGIKLLVDAVKRFTLLGHKTHAAALTYTTLFALVPLITVTFSALSMIPALQESKGEIEQLLMGSLVPSSGDAVMGYLSEFSEQARKLTTIGIILLMVTAFMMLRNIEDSFNQVWLLKRGRKGLSSFLLYWAILSLGPLMLSAGLAVSSYISSMSLWKEDWVPTSGVLLLGVVVPYITSFLVFTLIYWAVPNCKVPLKHAATGGAIVALLFELGQEVFAEASTFFPTYQLIYGAFAAVPLFLLWLFLSWSVILLGAEIVFLLGVSDEDEEDVTKRTQASDLLSTVKNSEENKLSPETLLLAQQLSLAGLVVARAEATGSNNHGSDNHGSEYAQFRGLTAATALNELQQNTLINSGVKSGINSGENGESLWSNAQDNVVSLYVLNIMSEQQIKGEGINSEALWHSIQKKLSADDADLTQEDVIATLTKLMDAKLLIQQPSGEYFLIRDLNRYPLAEFIR
jgi:YihY family inner membrane protein